MLIEIWKIKYGRTKQMFTVTRVNTLLISIMWSNFKTFIVAGAALLNHFYVYIAKFGNWRIDSICEPLKSFWNKNVYISNGNYWLALHALNSCEQDILKPFNTIWCSSLAKILNHKTTHHRWIKYSLHNNLLFNNIVTVTLELGNLEDVRKFMFIFICQ